MEASMVAGAEGSSGISGGSSLGSSAGSIAQSIMSGLMGQYFSKKNAKRAYAYSVDMWNRTNEYNKPINQVARLREAGLNPQLALGNISSASSAHMGSSPQISNDVAPFDFLNYILQKKQIEAGLKRTNAETKNINEDSRLKRANIKLADAQTLSNLEQIKLLGVQIQESLARLSNLGFQNDILKNKVDTGITGDDAFSNSLRTISNFGEKIKTGIRKMFLNKRTSGGTGR